jgi:DNA-binding response OmpR family regulator
MQHPELYPKTTLSDVYSLKKKLKLDENQLSLRTIRGFGYRQG